jgi:hypothetical protein
LNMSSEKEGEQNKPPPFAQIVDRLRANLFQFGKLLAKLCGLLLR